MDYYYLDSEGRVTGPLPEQTLKVLYDNRIIGVGTLVAAAGSEEWVPYETITRPSSSNAGPRAPRVPGYPSSLPAVVAPSREPKSGVSLVLVTVLCTAVAVVVASAVWVITTKMARKSETVAASPAIEKSSPDVPVPNAISEISEKPESAKDVMPAVMSPNSGSAKRQSLPSPDSSVSGAPIVASTNQNTRDVREPKGAGAQMRAESRILEGPQHSNVSPQDPLKVNSNPNAEWYDFGFHQGMEALAVFRDFGLQLTAERAHVAQLLRNMGLDAKDISPEGMKVCFEGYRDAVEGKSSVFAISSEQKQSILPVQLRGYNKFVGGATMEESAESGSLDHTLACTVMVKNSSSRGKAHGSGFFVAPGIIVTNRHVVDGASQLRVELKDGTNLPAEIIHVSTIYDVAIIKAEKKDNPVMRIGDAEKVKVGAQATLVGFPESDRLSATSNFGRISSTDRSYHEAPCFQLDLSANHGNSGGPVTNEAGEVIGVLTYGFGDLGVDRFNFAIKMSALLPIIREHCPEPLDVDE